MRDIGGDVGCTHALVARYFGSKDGLVMAVADRLAEGVAATVDDVQATAPDPLAGMLSIA